MTAEALPTLGCSSASLRRAAPAVTQLYDAALRPTGVRGTQFTLLQALERIGSSSQARLGELLALDPTTLSRTLRPLARAGWIRATPARDRRVVRWSLTPAGRRRLARAWPAWERVQERLPAGLSPAHWTQVVEDLSAVAVAAQRA